MYLLNRGINIKTHRICWKEDLIAALVVFGCLEGHALPCIVLNEHAYMGQASSPNGARGLLQPPSRQV